MKTSLQGQNVLPGKRRTFSLLGLREGTDLFPTQLIYLLKVHIYVLINFFISYSFSMLFYSIFSPKHPGIDLTKKVKGPDHPGITGSGYKGTQASDISPRQHPFWGKIPVILAHFYLSDP